jgi:hypothetical protein
MLILAVENRTPIRSNDSPDNRNEVGGWLLITSSFLLVRLTNRSKKKNQGVYVI